jgi:hypothetical protein
MKKLWINNLLSEGKTLCFRGHHFYSKGIEPSSIVLDWLNLYKIKYIVIPIEKIKYNMRIELSTIKTILF